jgi:glycosyltransferase involved in cell wall biosynthesis
MVRIPLISSCLEFVRAAFAPERGVKPQSIGIVISTYNNPRWLEKTLWGYLSQVFVPKLQGAAACRLEIVIADDGSQDETRKLIDAYRAQAGWNIKHVWQPDEGFQKCRILNKAVVASESEYLILTDQDCVPRADFVATHFRFAQKGYFLSGRYTKLPPALSEAITRADIEAGRAFEPSWLRSQGFWQGLSLKMVRSPRAAGVLNWLTPTKATWNGANSSGWRSDILAVNGFNERLHYGSEDVEMGARLGNVGIRPKQIRYSAVCIHLDHERPYAHPEVLARNRQAVRETIRSGIVETPFGIRKQ